MNERFTRVFNLERNLYTEGSPVIISAGALLKDNVKNIIVAQLKFKNISDKVIKAVKVGVLPKDVTGNEIDGELDFEYLDLNVKRDEEFGQKVPVVLKSKSTRSFSVTVKEVVFEDNTVLNIDAEWESLPEKKLLIDVFNNDAELLKEYRNTYGGVCNYNLNDYKDLWICTCGKENAVSEEKCHYCGIEYQTLKSVNLDELNENKEIRLEKERKIREQQEAEAREYARKLKKIAAIVTPIVIVVFVIMSAINSYNTKLDKYNEAIALISDPIVNFANYDSAIDTFESLGGFKDSDEQLNNAKYIKANAYNNYDNYNNASKLYAELGDYKDSKEKLQQVELIKEVDSILRECSGKYGSRSNENSSYYGFNKAAKLIKKFKGEKTDEMNKLYDDITLALKYYGKWKIKSGKLKAVGISNYYDDSVKKIAFNLVYDSTGVHLKMLPVQKGSEEKDGSFSYYSYETQLFKVSSEKKYKFECEGINYDSDSVSYIPAIKDNQFKIKLFEDGKYTANIVLSR